MLENVTSQMRVMREETFGPVAPASAFEGEQDAITRANDSPYGLAAYFFSRDPARIWRISEALE